MKHLMDVLEYRDRSIVAAEGSYLIDSEGNRLLDMYCDNGAVGLGYNHPVHQRAFQEMIVKSYSPHMINLYHFAERAEAAAMICERTGFDRAFFSTSGAEAVEACIKLARKWQYDRHLERGAEGNPRCEIWSIQGGFHGRTYGALRAGDGPSYHMDGFGPHLDRFYKFTIDDIASISTKAAAVILAPVFGHHDVIPYTHQQLTELREYCDEHGILLIFDEVQSGSGRTGEILYSQTVGVKPDITAMAKGVAAGFPIGICLATEEVARAFTPGTHFSTFGGNPGSMVFLKESLRYMTPDFLRIVREKAEATRQALEGLVWVKAVRNAGMLFVMDTDLDAVEFAKRCDARGLVIGAWRPNPIRFTPLLDAPMKDIVDAIFIMNAVAADMGAI